MVECFLVSFLSFGEEQHLWYIRHSGKNRHFDLFVKKRVKGLLAPQASVFLKALLFHMYTFTVINKFFFNELEEARIDLKF